jgi:hypothetical protein
VNSDLELERTSGRPADKTCCLIREEDMRNKPERQANDAYVQHQSIEKQQVNDAPAGPWTPAKAEVYQGEQHAQQSDDHADHLGPPRHGLALVRRPRALKSIALVHARLVLIHCLEAPLTLLTPASSPTLWFDAIDPNETLDSWAPRESSRFCDHCSHATGMAKIWMAH